MRSGGGCDPTSARAPLATSACATDSSTKPATATTRRGSRRCGPRSRRARGFASSPRGRKGSFRRRPLLRRGARRTSGGDGRGAIEGGSRRRREMSSLPSGVGPTASASRGSSRAARGWTRRSIVPRATPRRSRRCRTRWRRLRGPTSFPSRSRSRSRSRTRTRTRTRVPIDRAEAATEAMALGPAARATNARAARSPSRLSTARRFSRRRARFLATRRRRFGTPRTRFRTTAGNSSSGDSRERPWEDAREKILLASASIPFAWRISSVARTGSASITRTSIGGRARGREGGETARVFPRGDHRDQR